MASRLATVRVRTTIAAMVVVGAALVAVAFSLVILPRQSLLRRLDNDVRSSAQGVAGAVRAGIPINDVLRAAPDAPGTFFQVFNVDGILIGAGGQQFSATVPPPAPQRIETRELQGGDYRVFVEPAVDPSGRVAYVLAGAPTAPVEAAVGVIRRVLLVTLPLLLGLVGLAAWVVTGRALRPVERLRVQVSEISASELHRRVAEPDADDEVARLARTMNEMLNRIESSTDRQRRFVSDASHELRSPLATIRAQLEVALAAGDGGVDWRASARRVLDEEGRLQRLVDDLLLLARTDESQPTWTGDVDLDQLIADAAPRHALPVDVSAVAPARVKGDPHRLASVVRNLIENAVRHATARVAVTLEARDEVVLHVDDDGAGIAETDRELVFERFTRLDDGRAREAGGTGLGLAVVRSVVHAHGGTVTVGDSPLGGARFTVHLPR